MAAHVARRAARRTILLAEDDEEMRAMIAKALRRDGHVVLEAADGGALARRIAKRRHDDASVDLVITDVRMPGCSGLEVLESLREDDYDLPVILMTAFPEPSTRERAEALGAILFAKPFDLDDLRTAITNLA